jgi:hypothetical protein
MIIPFRHLSGPILCPLTFAEAFKIYPLTDIQSAMAKSPPYLVGDTFLYLYYNFSSRFSNLSNFPYFLLFLFLANILFIENFGTYFFYFSIYKEIVLNPEHGLTHSYQRFLHILTYSKDELFPDIPRPGFSNSNQFHFF